MFNIINDKTKIKTTIKPDVLAQMEENIRRSRAASAT